MYLLASHDQVRVPAKLLDHVAEYKLPIIGLEVVCNNNNIMVLRARFSQICYKVLDCILALENVTSYPAKCARVFGIFYIDTRRTSLLGDTKVWDMLKASGLIRDRCFLSTFKIKENKQERFLWGKGLGRLDVTEMIRANIVIADST